MGYAPLSLSAARMRAKEPCCAVDATSYSVDVDLAGPLQLSSIDLCYNLSPVPPSHRQLWQLVLRRSATHCTRESVSSHRVNTALTFPRLCARSTAQRVEFETGYSLQCAPLWAWHPSRHGGKSCAHANHRMREGDRGQKAGERAMTTMVQNSLDWARCPARLLAGESHAQEERAVLRKACNRGRPYCVPGAENCFIRALKLGEAMESRVLGCRRLRGCGFGCARMGKGAQSASGLAGLGDRVRSVHGAHAQTSETHQPNKQHSALLHSHLNTHAYSLATVSSIATEASQHPRASLRARVAAGLIRRIQGATRFYPA